MAAPDQKLTLEAALEAAVCTIRAAIAAGTFIIPALDQKLTLEAVEAVVCTIRAAIAAGIITMPAPDQKLTLEAVVCSIRAAIAAGTFPRDHGPTPRLEAPAPHPPPANDDVRELIDQQKAHRGIREFTEAWTNVQTEIGLVRELRRRMFISVAELLKIHTIPVVNNFDIQCVRKLWVDCGWRGYVVYPIEPVADFVTKDSALTLVEVTNLVVQTNTFPLTALNLELYDRQQLITIHRQLNVYGHWAAQVDVHLHQVTNLETLYYKAGVTLFSETCLPVVNEADVISVRRLRSEFGCILVPIYPRDCTDFTNVEQYQQVRAWAEANGFWL
ncbi:hypothetical protein RHSIM_Rhsim13G0038700 [Rhododendron simsii]|uniref:Uncharacterized protein n=1 Tax=Rhododendron simsii TaxID=118357 RepID=A0A834FZF4_RHOSS|nr:hypothetical protein RHSIM_Rhsim13G0038700 [Rhododendron simsii]